MLGGLLPVVEDVPLRAGSSNEISDGSSASSELRFRPVTLLGLFRGDLFPRPLFSLDCVCA
jgi:hypothetical protein